MLEFLELIVNCHHPVVEKKLRICPARNPPCLLHDRRMICSCDKNTSPQLLPTPQALILHPFKTLINTNGCHDHKNEGNLLVRSNHAYQVKQQQNHIKIGRAHV